MSKRKKNGNLSVNGKENGTKKNGNGNGNGIGMFRTRINIVAKSQHQKELLKSIKENVVTIVSGPPGSGKAQRASSLVYTPYGPVKMEDLKVGDEICTPNGGLANVVSIHPQGIKNVYRIFFADGDHVDCCEDHLWVIRDKYHSKKKKFKTDKRLVDTKFLIEKLKNISSNSKHRFKIDTPLFCKFNKKHVEIDPYLLGCLLGNGGMSHTLYFSSDDFEMIENIDSILSKYGCCYGKFDGKCTYSIISKKRDNDNYILKSLKKYSLRGKKSENKFIPDVYKINSRNIRLSVLQGLMDTDGTVSRKSGMASFFTSSCQMALDVKMLVESLGGICVIKNKKPFYYNRNKEKVFGKINYICHIRYNDTKDLFRLTRKKEKAKNRTKYLTKRSIRKIEKIDREECICIYIDSKEHLYLTDHFVPTHNTMISVVSGLREFVMGKYSKLIFTRPCVEANGENLGFLPGDLNEKIHPYMYPIFDFLSDYLSAKQIDGLIKSENIITLPLAFQRGITFKNSFVLLDEAQNTNVGQIRMFLTRIGDNCKVVITGDPNQSDVKNKNGLVDACERLVGIDGLGIVHFTEEDIFRHPIVFAIEEKYKT